MGQQMLCEVRIDDATYRAKVQLESEALIIRLKPSRVFPFSEMRSVEVDGEFLSIVSPEGRVLLHLEGKAHIWAQKILHPKSVIEKIGVKPTDVVSVIGLGDDPFVSELEAQARQLSKDRVLKNSSLIFFRVTNDADLRRIVTLKKSLASDGAIWILRPKGKEGVSEAETMRAGKAAGLVDIKVVKFSELLSAEKFVIPVKDRSLVKM